MGKSGKLHNFFVISTVLILIQGACVLGEVMDANPQGFTPNHVGTLTAEAVPTQNGSPTEANPPQIEPSPTHADSLEIAGVWHGTAQWLCDNNPIWSTRLEFKSNGSVIATLSTNTDYASADGSWVVNGNEISIQFETGLWIGTISKNTINGTFTEEHCNGIWSVSKD